MVDSKVSVFCVALIGVGGPRASMWQLFGGRFRYMAGTDKVIVGVAPHQNGIDNDNDDADQYQISIPPITYLMSNAHASIVCDQSTPLYSSLSKLPKIVWCDRVGKTTLR
jgi:hypothetical protein